MKLEEALKSRNRFKRKSEDSWRNLPLLKYPAFTRVDILADDWEVEEQEKIPLTRSEVSNALYTARLQAPYDMEIERILELLGFQK